MKKTYWWRITLIFVAVLILLISYIGPCNYKISRCFWGNSIYIIRAVFHIFLAVLVVSLPLCFVIDKVFLKWLHFAIIWIIIFIILIVLTPAHSGGWIPMNPTREMVSIWMGGLFVVVSLIKITWDSVRQK